MGRCNFFLPDASQKDCPAMGHWFFGTSAPALATHTYLIMIGLAAYMHNYDMNLLGSGAGYLSNFLTALNLAQYAPPAVWHERLCQMLMLISGSWLFPNPIAKWYAKTYGHSVQKLQLLGAVLFVSAASARLDMGFNGLKIITFSYGYFSGHAFQIRNRQVKWGNLLPLWFFWWPMWAYVANSVSAITNFEHLMLKICFFTGALAYCSMGSFTISASGGAAPAAESAKRGRPKSKGAKSRSRSKSAAKKKA